MSYDMRSFSNPCEIATCTCSEQYAGSLHTNASDVICAQEPAAWAVTRLCPVNDVTRLLTWQRAVTRDVSYGIK